jgi:prevent-host-death family protein
MRTVGIRELKQNASAVIEEVSEGAVFVVTDRGRAVATLAPLKKTVLEGMQAEGRIRPARRTAKELGPALKPLKRIEATLSALIIEAREKERY